MTSSKHPSYLQHFILTRVSEIMLVLLLVVILQLIFVQQLTQLDEFLDVIEIKSRLQQSNGLMTSAGYSFFSAIMNYMSGATTHQYLLDHTDFMGLNCKQSYDILKEFGFHNLEHKLLTNYLNAYGPLFEFKDVFQVELFQRTNRMKVTQIIYNVYMLASTIGPGFIRLPNEVDVTQILCNYIVNLGFFADMGSEISANINKDLKVFEQNIYKIVGVMVTLFILINLVSVYMFFKQQKLYFYFLDLFTHLKKNVLYQEIQKLKDAIHQIKSNATNFLKNQEFSIRAIDNQFYDEFVKKDETERHFAKMRQNKSNKLQLPLHKVSSFVKKFTLGLAFYICLIILYNYLLIKQIFVLIDKYKQEIKLIEYYTDSILFMNSVITLREFGYYYTDKQFFSFLPSCYQRETIIHLFEEKIQFLANFVEVNIQSDYTHFMHSSEFTNYIRRIQKTNLCTEYSDIMMLNTPFIKEVCATILDGSLTNGFQITLSRVITDLKDEYSNTNFQRELRNPPFPNADLMEAQLMLTQLLNHATQLIKQDTKDQLSSYKFLIQVLLYGDFLLLFMINVVFFGVIFLNKSKEEYLQAKGIPLLIPLRSFIFESRLYSLFEGIIKQSKIIDN